MVAVLNSLQLGQMIISSNGAEIITLFYISPEHKCFFAKRLRSESIEKSTLTTMPLTDVAYILSNGCRPAGVDEAYSRYLPLLTSTTPNVKHITKH